MVRILKELLFLFERKEKRKVNSDEIKECPHCCKRY